MYLRVYIRLIKKLLSLDQQVTRRGCSAMNRAKVTRWRYGAMGGWHEERTHKYGERTQKKLLAEQIERARFVESYLFMCLYKSLK